MSREQWQRAKEIFGAALEQAPGERAAFLDQACGPEDAELRREVEALLAAHEESDSFLETPAVAFPRESAVAGAAEGDGHPEDLRAHRHPRFDRSIELLKQQPLLRGRGGGMNQRSGRVFATVLFTDIVGSTERAVELGDRRWGVLLNDHHARARREIARFGGREAVAMGDGFLALFAEPAQAIRCAAALRDSVRQIGLEVRCGVHLGAIEQSGGEVGGITVHTGARVAAKAGPGEVLVSGTVREAEAGSGFGFEDRGTHALKGVPGEWRLFAVTSVPEQEEEPQEDEPGEGQRIGRYRVLGLLGTGGMGQVYLAEDPRLGRRVALKLLPGSVSRDADRLRRFEQEARAASALSHPNVCVIHEIGESGAGEQERRFIVMEHVPGESLRQRLERYRAAGTRMPLSEVLDVVQQTAAGLAAAHAAGIVHRDVKPENVMIRPDGLVKLVDFGLAKLSEHAAPGTGGVEGLVAGALTQPGMVVGTVKYMSPEQVRGLVVDARTDVWSLGATLYEMLAGRPAFEGPSTSDIMVAVLHREPPLHPDIAPGLPAELQRIVARALHKGLEGRYPAARELLLDLERLRRELDRGVGREAGGTSGAQAPDPASSLAVAPTADIPVPGTGRRSRRSAPMLAAAVLAGVLVTSALYLDLLGIGGSRQGMAEGEIAAAVAVKELLPQGESGGSDPAARAAPDGTEGRSRDGGAGANARAEPPIPSESRASSPAPSTLPDVGGSATTLTPAGTSAAAPGAEAGDRSTALLQDSLLLERQFDRLDTGLSRVRLEAIRDTTRLVWDRWSGAGVSARHRGRAAYLLGTVWNALDSPGQCVTWMERAVDLQPDRANYGRMLEVCRSLLP